MRVRVDFGRVFPGILLLISGLVLLALLALVAVVAYFFSFLAGPGALVGTVLTLMLVPALLIAGGIITMLTGVSWWRPGGESWISRTAKARASEDRIRYSGRIGEVFGVGISFIIFLFLYENQLRGVPFFTSAFGAWEQFFFYAPLFAGMALSLTRAFYGHRNGVRPFDSLNALFLAISAFWLLSVFPFDFTHLGDMFPPAIQFLFGWLTDDIGRLLFLLAGIGSLVNFAYTATLYAWVRGQLLMMRQKMF